MRRSRHEPLLILWMPPHPSNTREEAYTAAYSTLKEALTDVRVHLTARHHDQLAYLRLVHLAG
ncbi:hypothetical protein EF910_02135 [Streptomyces sp. WAC07149]|nr:hypothetical protein EF910_02135 [Streptomyces sp. WAC07149]